MSPVRLHHRACYQALNGRLLRRAADSGMHPSFLPSAVHCAAGSAMRGVRLWSGREHVRQVRNGRGVPQVHLDPQQGGTRWAHLAVYGGLCALDAPLQCLFLRAPARARGCLGSGARGHLGALRAPVSARRRGRGYRVAFPAEVAGVRDVEGWGRGVEAAEPGVVPPLAEGAPEFQQAGADSHYRVFSGGLLATCHRGVSVVVEGRYEVMSRRAVLPLGGRHFGVTPREVGHKSIQTALVCGAPVEEGQQGAVGDRLPLHSSPSQPSSSRRIAVIRSVGSMSSRGPGTSPSRDRASSYVGPDIWKCATVSRVPPSSGGSHRTVAVSHPHV